ncbi:MAG: 2-C-methyl-D-erythritol 2,4-cyclodiphosphate synthase [Lachnospiraceae bacterium]|nr:2-C-methyl-D-erythritol 2,4-cyclodiphosphate synthase [Lachnospiraceae bacterium]
MRVAIGQDSHRFDVENKSGKPLILAGVVFENETPFEANSDGDVILHAITRAVSGITTIDILGPKTKQWIKEGKLDSRFYLQEALKDLNGRVAHLSVSVECKKPRLTPKIPEMRRSLAELLHTDEKNIGITATSGEELTDFGRGLGMNVFAVLTVED